MTKLKTAFFVILLNLIFIPQYEAYKSDGNNLFKLYVNDTLVGTVGKSVDVDALLLQARREVAGQTDAIVMMDSGLRIESSEVVFAETDSEKMVRENMVDVLKSTAHNTLRSAYSVKIGVNSFNLSSIDDVKQVLQAAIDVYDTEGEYQVMLQRDPGRELNTLMAIVVPREEAEAAAEIQVDTSNAGIETAFEEIFEQAADIEKELDFDDYHYGLLEMEYGTSVEIVDAYLSEDQISSVEDAISKVTSKQEKNTIYEVQAGDTLSGISYATDIPMDKIIELNESLEDEHSTIRVGQELLISNPQPPLAINRVECEYVEEDYDAEVQYVDNDEWYTTDKVTLQQPSAGHRKIVAQINYVNDKEVGREIIKQEVDLEAVPKIVERGTKTPPTYIKPISGGRMSSTFGRRNAPTKGASSNHQGIDWAIASGSAVYASSGGTVTKAGWAKGYGYVVYIQHPDGKETRYGHLSKVQCSVGQHVKQGDKIALSGNSGVSTGPHLHFELRINGAAVNPLKYIN